MTSGYSIEEMKSDLSSALDPVQKRIRDHYVKLFQDLRIKKEAKGFSVFYLDSSEVLSAIPKGEGFYAILTSLDFQKNNCTLIRENKLDTGIIKYQAIYRGECSSMQRRIESHLYNNDYKKNYNQRKEAKEGGGEKFSEPYYGACIKVEPGISGINIDSDKKYKDGKWAVLILRMPNSNSLIRKQTELAFDSVFNKPLASRE